MKQHNVLSISYKKRDTIGNDRYCQYSVNSAIVYYVDKCQFELVGQLGIDSIVEIIQIDNNVTNDDSRW